jgi:hypothetical protein
VPRLKEPDDDRARNGARFANALDWQAAIDNEWDRLRPHLTNPDYADAIAFNQAAQDALVEEFRAITNEHKHITGLRGDTLADFGLTDETGE